MLGSTFLLALVVFPSLKAFPSLDSTCVPSFAFRALLSILRTLCACPHVLPVMLCLSMCLVCRLPPVRTVLYWLIRPCFVRASWRLTRVCCSWGLAFPLRLTMPLSLPLISSQVFLFSFLLYLGLACVTSHCLLFPSRAQSTLVPLRALRSFRCSLFGSLESMSPHALLCSRSACFYCYHYYAL